MWFSALRSAFLLSCFSAVLPGAEAAEPMLVSNSLNTCQENSLFTASLFKVTYTPNNNTAFLNIVATSSVEGMVVFDISISAYGHPIIKTEIDPCKLGLAGLCPMTAGKIPLKFNLPVGDEAASQIPSIAYNFPDLDATVRVFLNLTETRQSVACVEADISNGKTVDLIAIKWVLAIISGLILCSSAIINGLGHSNAAAHIASGALSLFGFFQAQAMLGLTAIHLPPVVQSWTQDFQWSMGIINVDFMQDIFTWYQRATGGTPSTIFDSLTTVSVQVEKRGLSILPETAVNLYRRSAAMLPRALGPLLKRANVMTGSGSYIVFGIQRAAFRAGIETTNVFMTGLTFFCLLVIFTIGGVAAFKGFCELAVKQKWMKGDTFLEFRNGWLTVLKGILFRLTLIGYPQMSILCLWEFTQVDSAAEVVLAVFFIVGMTVTMGWAAMKVIRMARRSVAMHRNPAYILFSDPQALNKWGFLYIQFRASAYYFIIPILGYTLVKSMFIAFAQGNSTAQAIGFLLIEAAALITASVLRPWMDKSTNSFNIAICVVNFLNAIFLLIFSDVFNQPPLVNGVIGLILFFLNAIFATVLLIMVIVSTTLVFYRKNPDGRYQFMADDRASFMKSQSQLTGTTELDALAATARGDKAGYKHGLDLDDDNESISSASMRRRTDTSTLTVPAAVPNGAYGRNQHHNSTGPSSPVDPSVPLFPAGGAQRTPSPYGGSSVSSRQRDNNSPPGSRAQNNASPWQRGAGYEH
ncbi:TRP-domain-containing protein [Durotheca rogersii]|uniref:TRP-domain-containing protein n=1 Tax=Durotheca rogersii TaxID=419775 RepID=UPI0022204AE3|nr:TRP-domain-containing protein [Durotheca rogersii]KAI5859709.1 TRP-domain-containing protein [Durotheca rogersii]